MVRVTTKIIGELAGWNRYAREPKYVLKLFSLRGGIRVGRLTLSRFCRYSNSAFDGLLSFIELVRTDSSGRIQVVKKVKVDPPEKVTPIEGYSKLDISKEELINILRHRISNLILDLRGINRELEEYQMKREEGQPVLSSVPEVRLPRIIKRVDNRVDKLVDVIINEAEKFGELANDPNATIEQVFDLIDKGKTRLGFLNVAVYRPLRDEEGNWVLTKRTRHWTQGLGKYDPAKGGHVPVSTLGSVLNAQDLVVDVNLCDRKTFERAGIKYDEESANTDFEHAKGAILRNGEESRRLLYIKLRSGNIELSRKYGVEGVVLFHNQVRRTEKIKPKPLLPEDSEEAERVKNILKEFYVGGIIRAIENIRRREIQEMEQQKLLSLGARAKEYDPERLWHALQARFPMTDFKKFRDRLSGKVVRLEVMDLREPHKNVDEDLILDLIACKREISQKAWEKNTEIEISGYTDEYIVKHFMQVDREFLVYDPKVRDIVAFCGMNRLKGKDGLTVHVLEVSMVKPDYQNMRISSALVSRLIIDAFIANRLNPITVAGRTANPQVLGAMLALSDCFPNPFDLEALPTEQQRKVFGLVADFLNPGETKDEISSVIHDVYPLATGLIVPPEKIPDYSKDPGVKALCEKLLQYERYNRPDFFPGELDSTDLESIISSLNIMMDAQLIRSGEEAVENAFNTAILGFTGFYDKIKSKLDGVELDPFILSLIKLTEEDRKVDFDRLNQKKQHIIMTINRMLLEALFPSLPKRAAKAMVVQGIITTKAKKAFEKKQRRRRMQNFLLSWLQKRVNR